MSLNSVNNILKRLEIQAQCQEQPLPQVLRFWSQVVGDVINTHTRPLSIHRNVLRVATSSPAWAQNLTFGRQRLLLKLNPLLATPLADIHFSAAFWQSPPHNVQQERFSLDEHPSYVGIQRSVNGRDSSCQNPQAAFQDWAKTVQALSDGLPLCTECQCPTPAGEIQRWGICCVCAAKKFQQSKAFFY